jgi:hypothetical protein
LEVLGRRVDCQFRIGFGAGEATTCISFFTRCFHLGLQVFFVDRFAPNRYKILLSILVFPAPFNSRFGPSGARGCIPCQWILCAIRNPSSYFPNTILKVLSLSLSLSLSLPPSLSLFFLSLQLSVLVCMCVCVFEIPQKLRI